MKIEIIGPEDPNHQTDHCDYCGHVFIREEDETIPTLDRQGAVTLCRACYKKAGNNVR